MKASTLSLLLLCSICGFGQAMACEYPRGRVDIANGTTASKEEILASQKSVKAHLAAMQGYLDCLAAEEQAAGAADTPEEADIRGKRHNAAVEAMETLADRFNEQVRAYKAANP